MNSFAMTVVGEGVSFTLQRGGPESETLIKRQTDGATEYRHVAVSGVPDLPLLWGMMRRDERIALPVIQSLGLA